MQAPTPQYTQKENKTLVINALKKSKNNIIDLFNEDSLTKEFSVNKELTSLELQFVTFNNLTNHIVSSQLEKLRVAITFFQLNGDIEKYNTVLQTIDDTINILEPQDA